MPGQGSSVLAVGAGGRFLDIVLLTIITHSHSLSLIDMD